ncbi:hypothetical protein GCM10010522_31630 [Kribbella solani]
MCCNNPLKPPLIREGSFLAGPARYWLAGQLENVTSAETRLGDATRLSEPRVSIPLRPPSSVSSWVPPGVELTALSADPSERPSAGRGRNCGVRRLLQCRLLIVVRHEGEESRAE